ncbi:hypothetical protein AC579_5507 [Pseudocercospora musae]|uniref:DH domain-containing protein n=1 Tax=Pseudocercospora musae TaxID=113226 RepID=A0A139IMB6_9PEZI|nr:hypothetical protein AC579_5507 [Pseudocercospora musae]
MSNDKHLEDNSRIPTGQHLTPMPSPPNHAARKASAKKTPEEKADLTTQKLARKRSQDLASKIAGWNQAGGGVAQQQDEIVVIEDPTSELGLGKKGNNALHIVVETESSAPAQDDVVAIVQEIAPDVMTGRTTPKASNTLSGTKKAGRDVDLGRGAWVRRKSKPQAEVAADVKHAGAPKKRVVSDGHWRRDRQKVEEKASPEKEEVKAATPHKPVIVRRSGALSMGMKVPPSFQDFSASDPEPEPIRVRPLRYPRSRSRSRSPVGRGATPEFESTGTKVYIKRRTRSRTAGDLRNSETSLTAPSSVDKPGTAETDITTPSSSPPRPKSEPRERLRKSRSRDDQPRSKSAKQSPNTDGVKDTRRRSKPALDDAGVTRHLSVTAEAFAKRITQTSKKSTTTAPPAPKQHGTRIEGWLAAMPDPFTESRRSSLTPEPLDIPKKKRSKQQIEVEYESESRKSSAKTRNSRKDDDITLDTRARRSVTPETEASASSPTLLKRRGARRNNDSPIKNNMSREVVTGVSTSYDAVMSGALPDTQDERRGTTSAKKNDRFRIPSGQRLSTIASDETLHARGHGRAYSEDATTTFEGSVLSRASDGDSPRRGPSGLKRRTTKHDDLMSVLSRERRTRNSRRSVRHSQRRPEAANIGAVMNDLSAEELKYQRELRTLVDGVIPVLLQHALSDTSSSSKARVFSRPTNDEVTRPVVEMGVALERLKTTHRKIPLHEPGELLLWADSAAKVYADYLRVWRLGFNDIVVNLAPAEAPKSKDLQSWDHDLPRNRDGDLVDGTGERVDVAQLLKRPLVRLKYLAKTFKSINSLKPSANAEDMTAKYHDLIAEAKKRVNDEQARLEDEAAASIDATRARDPRSLAPITGVSIDPTRSVRARDYFDMDLVHSSGQQLGCKIEIIFRDDAPNRGKAGDILFCEISVSGRWLLFPPIPWSLVSARAGERPGELVVMIRGFLSNARQWREVMSLRAETEDTSADWLEMLGSEPMPPRLNRRSSFNMFKQHGVPAPALEEPKGVTVDMRNTPDKSRDPSPREIEVPIGEQVKSSSRIWDGSDVNGICNDDGAVTSTSAQRAKAKRYRSMTTSQSTPEVNHHNARDQAAQPAYFYEQARANVPAHHNDRRPRSSHIRSQSEWTGSTVSTERSSEYSVWMPSSDRGAPRYSEEETTNENDPPPHSTARPAMHRRTSSVPSMSMPTIPKVRQPTRSESPSSDRDGLPSQKRAAAEVEKRLPPHPASAPSKIQKRTSLGRRDPNERPPDPPAHREKPRPLSLGQNLANKIPSLTPAFLKKTRRPSSPLKHEYEPSTASESLSDSDLSDDFSDEGSETSESTIYDAVDHELPMTEDGLSIVGDLRGFQDYTKKGLRQSPPPATGPSPRYSIPGASLAPSDSASQAPYRTVPTTVVEPAKIVASICAWSERGSWDSLHPEECQIFITPGLIEAFDLVQANSVQLDDQHTTPSAKGIKPLVALELTPLVPLRRGTAVDISIRSPPSANSLLKSSSNIMFRSRSPEDCERLYALINRARIDNPTYIALQNARGPVQQSNWGEIMDQRPNPMDKRRSWWNLGSRKSSTYRSQGSRAQSTAATESSVGTVGTAFSALRRFSGGSKFFNIGKSTITSRDGTRSTNSGSLSSGTATPIQFDPSVGTPLGITNAKVRMYMRESAGRWRDMGAARLTVLLPPRQDPTIAADPRVTGLEKRVIVSGKSKGERMLDVTLGESAFERVARTGIAVSVYEESPHVGAIGGVLPHQTTVYMIQLKSEREAAYTFGLVGKLRY